MHIMIDKKDLEQAFDFINSGGLVMMMNEQGLSIGAMSLILDSIFKGLSEVEKRFENEDEEI